MSTLEPDATPTAPTTADTQAVAGEDAPTPADSGAPVREGTPRGHVTDMGRVQRLARFVVVGGVGFLVSTGVLAVLVAQGLPNFVASLLATEVAVIGNYLLHEVFTFGTRRPTWRKLGTYNLAAGVGLVITAIAFDVISRFVPEGPLILRNLLAVGCGTTSNFLLSARFVWRTRAWGVTDE